MDIRPYDIVFFKNNSIISKLIKWFTKSEYSHVGIVTIDTNFIFDANMFKRTTCRKLKLDKNTEIYRISANIDYNRALSWIFEHSYLPYDMGEILKILLNIRTEDNDNKFICSTLVLDFIKDCTNDPRIENLHIVSPQELIDLGLVYKIN